MRTAKIAGGGRGRPRKPPARANQTWTVEETGYLLEHWGCRGGIPAIAKALGRSELAIKMRASHLKLGPYLDGGALVSFNMLYKVISGVEVFGSYTWTLERWQALGLPVKKVRVQQCQFLMVSIDAFWRWGAKHQNLLDFSRFEENALGAEPEWVKRKRKIDRENRRFLPLKRCPWSREEDERLRWLCEHEATYAEIGKELRRSSGAIRRRIYDLYLPRPKEAPITKWTPDEMRRLAQMIETGYNINYCANSLNRSPEAVRGKIEWIHKKGLWDEYAGTKVSPSSHRQNEQGPRQDVRGTDRGQLPSIRS